MTPEQKIQVLTLQIISLVRVLDGIAESIESKYRFPLPELREDLSNIEQTVRNIIAL